MELAARSSDVLLLPAIYLVIQRTPRLAIPLWAFSCVLAEIVPRIIGRADVFRYAPCFMSGILAYALAASTGKRKLPSWMWLLAVGGTILLFQPFENRPLTDKLPLAWVLSLAIGMVLPYTAELSSRGLHRITHLIARYSYGIYLTHIIILWIAVDVLHNTPVTVRVLVFLAGLVTLPVLLFHTVENPMIHWGHLLAKKLTARTAGSAEPHFAASPPLSKQHAPVLTSLPGSR